MASGDCDGDTAEEEVMRMSDLAVGVSGCCRVGTVTEEGGPRDKLELNSPLSPPSWLTSNADHNRS